MRALPKVLLAAAPLLVAVVLLTAPGYRAAGCAATTALAPAARLELTTFTSARPTAANTSRPVPAFARHGLQTPAMRDEFSTPSAAVTALGPARSAGAVIAARVCV